MDWYGDQGDTPAPKKKKSWEDKIPRSEKAVPIQSALQDMISYLDFKEDLEGLQVFELWDEVVGKTIAEVAQPVSLTNRHLTVAVRTPSWRHELTYLSLAIIEKINTKVGAEVVSSIRFDLKKHIDEGKQKVDE